MMTALTFSPPLLPSYSSNCPPWPVPSRPSWTLRSPESHAASPGPSPQGLWGPAGTSPSFWLPSASSLPYAFPPQHAVKVAGRLLPFPAASTPASGPRKTNWGGICQDPSAPRAWHTHCRVACVEAHSERVAVPGRTPRLAPLLRGWLSKCAPMPYV